MQERNKLYINYVKLKTVNNEDIHKSYRKKLNRIVQCAENIYHSDRLDPNKTI